MNEELNTMMTEEVADEVIDNVPEVAETVAKKGIPTGVKRAGIAIGGAALSILAWEKLIKPVGNKLIAKVKAKKAAKKAAKEGIDPRTMVLNDIEQQYDVK